MKKLSFSLFLLILGVFQTASAQLWVEVLKTVPADRVWYDQFGSSVSIFGDYAVIGAALQDHDEAGSNAIDNAGAAYIYKFNHVTFKWEEKQKIVAGDRRINAHFGTNVCIFGNYIAIGAESENYDELGNNFVESAGAVYIFERNGMTNTWIQKAKLVAPDRESFDLFGKTCAIYGEKLVVGANLQDKNATNTDSLNASGAAYIFERSTITNQWSFSQKLVASDRKTGDLFGKSVSIYGDYISVGSYSDEDASGGNYKAGGGAVYIYKRNTSTNKWEEKQKIVAADRQINSVFGESVSLYGDYLAVGATEGDKYSTLQGMGSVYVYKKDSISNIWNSVQKLKAPTPTEDMHFGYNVSLNGSYLVVGTYEGNAYVGGIGAGSAYLFKLNSISKNWGIQQALLAGDPEIGDFFGNSVGIYGDNIIISAFNEKEDAAGSNTIYRAGSAYFFQKDLAPFAGDINLMGKKNVAIQIALSDFTENFTVANGDTLIKIKIETLPPNGTLKLNGVNVVAGTEIIADPRVDKLYFYPNLNFVGTASFDWNGHDGVAYAKTVGKVNLIYSEAPTVIDDSFTIDEDEQLSNSVSTNDTPSSDGGNVWKVQTQPQHGTISMNTNGSFTYTPDLNYHGTDVFTYTLSDADGSVETGTVTINIKSVNDLPLVIAAPIAGLPGILIKGFIFGLDIESLLLKFKIKRNPSHGKLSLYDDGTYDYTPDPNYYGSDSFEILVIDEDGGTTVITVNVNVIKPNGLPEAVKDHFDVKEETVLYANVGNNDVYSDDGGNYFTLLQSPSMGTINFNADGSFNYTPNLNQWGNDSFTYSITDINGDVSINTAIIKIIERDIFIPEGFSPNNDNVNDFFEIPDLYRYPNNSIVILNRWGDKVYEAAPYQNNWNGTSERILNGGATNELPAGTYFYIIDLDNGRDARKGTIYLNR